MVGLRPLSLARQVQRLLDPLFWPSMLSAVSNFLVLAHFSLSLPLILFNHVTIYRNTPNVAHVINRPCHGVQTSSHRDMGHVARKPKVVAFQQHGRRHTV